MSKPYHINFYCHLQSRSNDDCYSSYIGKNNNQLSLYVGKPNRYTMNIHTVENMNKDCTLGLTLLSKRDLFLCIALASFLKRAVPHTELEYFLELIYTSFLVNTFIIMLGRKTREVYREERQGKFIGKKDKGSL